MSHRFAVGVASILLFANEFAHLGKLPFPYKSTEEVQHPKHTYVVTFKFLQHALNKFRVPQTGELVMVERPDRSLYYGVVEATPQSYYFQEDQNMSFYVPDGFVLVNNPLTQDKIMTALANVKGKKHYFLSL